MASAGMSCVVRQSFAKFLQPQKGVLLVRKAKVSNLESSWKMDFNDCFVDTSLNTRDLLLFNQAS